MPVVQIIAQQHVWIVRYPSRFHGRGPQKGDQYAARQAEKMRDAIGALPRDRLGALLGHKPHVQLLQKTHRAELEKMGVLTGWWGRAERGHNEWSGRHLAIFGGPYLGPQDQASQYSAARVFALSAGGPVHEWPAWTGEMVGDLWIQEGATEVHAGAPLPANPKIRAWLLRHYVASVVQAIGRVRGVWQTAEKPCEIHLYGGLPLWELWEHGLEVGAYKEDPRGWRTSGDYHAQRALDARERLIAALEALEAVGGVVSFRNVNDYLHSVQQQGLGASTYRDLIRELGWAVQRRVAPRRSRDVQRQ